MIRIYRGNVLIKEVNYDESINMVKKEATEAKQSGSASAELSIPRCHYLKPIDNEDNVTVVEGQPDEMIQKLTKEYFINPGNIELDCCGTGTGKTTRVLTQLIPYAAEHGMHILYVSPRVMINEQIIEKINNMRPHTIKWGMRRANGETAMDEGIDGNIAKTETETFYFSNKFPNYPTITVMTAQKLYYELCTSLGQGRLNRSTGEANYHIVVFDEVHSVLDDAIFCVPMNFILSKIFQFFRRSVAYIFMSATMEGVDRVIYETSKRYLGENVDMAIINEEWVKKDSLSLLSGPGYERHYHRTGRRISYEYKPSITKYIIPADYGNYRVRYLRNEIDDIVSIYRSLPKNRKLLVFVSSIKDGKKLLDILPGSVLVFSEGNTGEKMSAAARIEWENIIKKEKFDCRCLIATKVLDAGINLHDDALCDIAILCNEKNELIQCLGRKRDISRSAVTLYIAARDSTYFSGKNNSLCKKLEAAESLEKCLNCRAKSCPKSCRGCNNVNFFDTYITNTRRRSEADGIYSCFGGDFVVLPLAVIKVRIQEYYCRKIQNRFRNEGEKAFILEQLSWLGLEDTYSEDNWYSQTKKPACTDDLVSLLENKRIIPHDETPAFRAEIEKIFISLGWYEKRPENTIGCAKINQTLKNHGIQYKICSEKEKNQTIWVIKFDNESASKGDDPV